MYYREEIGIDFRKLPNNLRATNLKNTKQFLNLIINLFRKLVFQV